MTKKLKLTAKTGSSVVVDRCQVCDSSQLDSVLFLGYLPPVNEMKQIGARPKEEPSYPAEWLRCPQCQLVQLGLIVDPHVLFPPTYPYTSGTTKILRENFAELAQDCRKVIPISKNNLVVDIGSNDGTLLGNFKNLARVRGIEPSDRGKLAQMRGIPTLISFFNEAAVESVLKSDGKANVITATNVFAHIEDVHSVVDNVLKLLDPSGVFISESHYLLSLVQTLQYDTIYHEHLRYYSLTSLQGLLRRHDLEIIHAKKIPTHGGSIRVYAARKGVHPVQPSVSSLVQEEDTYGLGLERLRNFKEKVIQSKLDLLAMLKGLRESGVRVSGIGAPSRASTLITYAGLDDGILDCVYETKGSYKIGMYMPGTLIPVVDEENLYRDERPQVILLLSWHIADELMPKIKSKGFKGDFIVPLPTPRIIKNADVSN